MERELYSRLIKLIGEHKINLISPKGLLDISVATLRVIQAHQAECHPSRDGDAVVLDEAIAVINDYR